MKFKHLARRVILSVSTCCFDKHMIGILGVEKGYHILLRNGSVVKDIILSMFQIEKYYIYALYI